MYILIYFKINHNTLKKKILKIIYGSKLFLVFSFNNTILNKNDFFNKIK